MRPISFVARRRLAMIRIMLKRLVAKPSSESKLRG
jgi:hypothetical protein